MLCAAAISPRPSVQRYHVREISLDERHARAAQRQMDAFGRLGKAHLTVKVTGPIEASDAGLRPLLAAGMDTLAIDSDLGAAWTEASRTFALDPATIELGGLLKAQARVSLANKVSRAVSAA